jgi:hypothetical protein
VKIINAIEFASFCDGHLELWSKIEGANINHSKYGAGKIVSVGQRCGYMPLIYARFENKNEEITFNSDSFKSGFVENIQVSEEINAELQKWKLQFINEMMRQNITEKLPRNTHTTTMSNFFIFGIKSLWHMSHRDNIVSICQHGILNYYEVHKLNALIFDISDPDVQRWRDRRDPHFNRPIHLYAPLYISPRNPMLYKRKEQQPDICILEIDLSVIDNEFLLTDGNAASTTTKFFKNLSDLNELPWDILNDRTWFGKKDGKRKMCAEVLIYPKVEPKYIKVIHCYNSNVIKHLDEVSKPIRITPELYFGC